MLDNLKIDFLEPSSYTPSAIAVSSARTCYSSRGLITPEESLEWERTPHLLESIFKSGHHTTLQHTHFTLLISGMSRLLIWRLLHSHSFHNCLAGDTIITNYNSGANKSKTIKELYEQFSKSDKRQYVFQRTVRSVDENGIVVAGKIKNVVYSGKKKLFKVKTRLGYEIKSTKDHRFMLPDGSFKRLKELTKGDFIKVNGIPIYQDREWLHKKYYEENLSQAEIGELAKVSPHTIRGWIKRYKLAKQLGSWSIGATPHNNNKTKDNYEPLYRSSMNLKGYETTAPRDRIKLWFKAEECIVYGVTKHEKRIERHHKDRNPYNNNEDNILILCSMCHSQAYSPHGAIRRTINDMIISIEYIGNDDTYDIEMDNEYHNFVANGFVVHNSEQISQRFAKPNLQNVYIPNANNIENLNLWQDFYNKKFSEYYQLNDILMPIISKKLPKFKQKEVPKKAGEIARYIFPIGLTAYLYHTVNLLTVLRYINVAKSLPEAKNEALKFAELLEIGLLKIDIKLKPLIDFAKREKSSFPDLDINKYSDKNIVFDITGNLENAIGERYSGILRTSQMFHDESILGGFSSVMRLSLSADAQNQRHRRSLGIRPKLATNFKTEAYLPEIIRESKEAERIYINSIDDSYNFFLKMRKSDSFDFGELAYALPNGHLITIVERNDWSSFAHKSQMRLCLNAQEEIFNLTFAQVKKINELGIAGNENLAPPCSLRFRDKTFPVCPEGDRFCGVKVWKIPLAQLKREI
jgi:thymidylate synthase ThyX